MKTLIPLLSAALTACSPVLCETPCGVLITGERLAHSCEDYRAVEWALLQRIEGVFPDACRSWNGVEAVTYPGEYTLVDGDKQMGGWTTCDGRIHFHRDHPRAWDTGFGHELIHVAQRCNASLPVDEGRDVDHADWTRLGLYRALANMKTELYSKELP